MSRQEFNDWRKANDLPKLFAFLRTALPHFPEWLEAHGISEGDFVTLDHTSHLLVGTQPAHLVESTKASHPTQERRLFVSLISGKELLRGEQNLGLPFELHSSKPFIPYFHWLHTVKHLKRFPILGDRNHALTDDLRYMMWEGSDLSYTRAFLLKNFPVLKLGGLKISPQELDERNLDFVDLDGLEIAGTGWTRSTSIAYSSCRFLRMIDTDKAFLTFLRCDVEELHVERARIQDLHFIEGSVPSPTFLKSKLSLVSFLRCVPARARFEDCEIRDLILSEPPNTISHGALSDTYKRLRVAFQREGNRQEASRYYYLERRSELLSRAIPLRKLPSMPLVPHVFRALGALLRLLPHILDWAIWGFGEKPSRVFMWMGGVLFLFAGKYYFFGKVEVKGDVLASLSCSAFNLATIGCEYKVPFDSLEGLLGAALMGVMVAGFSNRTRY